MRRGLSRSSETGGHGLGTRGWGSLFSWEKSSLWWEKSSLWWGPAAALLTLMEKVAAAFSQTLWQNGEQKDKRQRLQVSAKDCSQEDKRKHFQDRGCQIFEHVADKSCGGWINLLKTQLDTAPSNPSWRTPCFQQGIGAADLKVNGNYLPVLNLFSAEKIPGRTSKQPYITLAIPWRKSTKKSYCSHCFLHQRSWAQITVFAGSGLCHRMLSLQILVLQHKD